MVKPLTRKKASKRGVVKNYKVGRICKKIGCNKKLSMYNSEEYCYVHRQEFL